MRKRFPAVAATALLAVLALAGCTSGASDTKPVPTVRPSTQSALSDLVPVYPAHFTAATAKKETVRVADAIQGLIATNDTVYVDDHSKLVAATKSSPSYYGVLRTVNVSKSLDPVQQAEAMSKILIAAGWVDRKNESATGTYVDQLTSLKSGAKTWLLQVSGDSSVATEPVVTIDILSPDLPTK